MNFLDGILKQVAGAPDDVENLAAKVGIDPGLAEKAIAALGQSHQQPGDTVGLAAEKTGLDPSILSQVVTHIGGEGSLGEFARMLSQQAGALLGMLDRDGDGNPLNDLGDIASGFFGKK